MTKPIILVSSCLRDVEQGVNDIWRGCVGKFCDAIKLPYFFILGENNVSSRSDELCFPVDDKYHGLPYKTVYGHLWALERGYTHMFQCFSDTFLVPERLIASGYENHAYTGNKHEGCRGIPALHGGPGYWLSADATMLLVNHKGYEMHGMKGEDEVLEDQHTAHVMHLNGIKPQDDRRYSMGTSYSRAEEFPTQTNDIISVHLSDVRNGYWPTMMIEAFAHYHGAGIIPGASKPELLARSNAGKPLLPGQPVPRKRIVAV